MSTIEDMITEIKGESWRQYTDNEEYRRGVYLDDVGDIIRKHCEGMVLVPTQLIKDIDDLTEAGLFAVNQIDELCELLSASQGKSNA
jgi:hypothetical protein